MGVSLFIRKGAKKETAYLSCRVYYTERGKAAVNLTVATKLPVGRLAWEKGHDGNVAHFEAWSRTSEGKQVAEAEEILRKAVDGYVLASKGRDKERIKRIVESTASPVREDIPTTLVGFCERYVEECETGARLAENGHHKGELKTRSTRKQYQYFISKIKAYEADRNMTVAFRDVNTAFVADFRVWLMENGLKTNTIASYNRLLYVFLHAAERKGLVNIGAIDVPSLSFKAPDAVYLTQERLDALWGMDFGDDALDGVRDTFLVGCETGQRYSDYKRITAADVVRMKDGSECVRITQKKTGKTLFVPLSARLRIILERSGGRRSYCTDRFNRGIKEVCRLAGFTEDVEVTAAYGLKREKRRVPFYELVSSHTARRTCATLMYLAGCPLADIMAVTGHSEESTLRKYLRMTDEEKGIALANSR